MFTMCHPQQNKEFKMFVVTITTTQKFYLRGTIFTSYLDRATQYPTEQAANVAIEAAAKFHAKKTIKALTIENTK